MGKDSPSVGDPFRNLQNTAFPGLITPSFSLLRAQPTRTTAAPQAQSAFQPINQQGQGNIRLIERGKGKPLAASLETGDILGPFNRRTGVVGGTGGGLTQQGGQGPFQLTRTDPFVPQTEQRLFGALEANRQGLRGLQAGFAPAREGLNFLEDRLQNLLLPESARARQVLEGVLQDVEPGFGRLTESLVEGVRNRAAQATGNLRSALNQRNVLGASFANQQLASTSLDFAQEEERVRNEAFVQELQATQQIVGQIGQFLELDQRTLAQQAQAVGLRLGLNEAEANLFSRELQNLQTQAQLLGQVMTREFQELGISGNLVNQAQATAAQLAGLQAQLDAQAAADSGSLFGSFLGLGASLLTAPAGPLGIGAAFGGSAAATNFGSLFGGASFT